ncbi:MAG: restriction endonuclease subunit S, partial [Candidatus Methylophosphatis roskildensis]
MSGEAMEVKEPSARYLANADADDVPRGYVRTEVGVIPEDWERALVGSVARVKGGKRLPAGFALVDEPTPHPYVRVSDMYRGGVDTSAIKYVPEAVFPAIQSYRIYEEDIFISVAGTLGIVGVVPAELSGANLTENADRITDLRCDRDYLKYWLMSQPIQQTIESIQTIGAQPKLALGRIARFDIAIPRNATEQRAIAEALSDVDGLLGGLEALIAKKRAIKQAAMQQLLTGKTRLPGFSGEWGTKRLHEVAPLQRGFDLPTGQICPGPYPVVYSNGVLQFHHQRMVRGPGVVTGRSGTIGKVHFIETDYWPHNTALWVTSFRGNEPK